VTSHVRIAVRKHPLIAFVAVAFGFSWAWWIPLWVHDDIVRQGVSSPTYLPGLLGPLVAAVLVSACEGTSSLGDLVHRIARVGVAWWWYALALMTLLLGVGSMSVSGHSLGDDSLRAYSGVGQSNLVLLVALVLVVNGLGEEAGWRGFLADRLLRRHSVVTTSILVAAVWALWHLPLFFVVDSFRGLGIATLGWVFGLACGSVVLTWMYVGTGRSIFFVAVWHTTYNLVTGTAGAGGPPAAVTSTAVMALAVAIVLVGAVARRGSAQRVAEPEASTARAASSLATGMRNGEHET
jgi:membrane protease YdiL (CAAX protease family)